MGDIFYENKDTYGDTDKWNDDRKNICLSFIERAHPEDFLDIGCGDGYFCEIVRNRTGAHVTGIDISQTACDLAKQKNIDIIVGDLQQTFPFENNTFDTIFCGEVIEHVTDTDFLLDEIHRVMKENGYLIMTTPNMASWYNRILFVFGIQPIFTEVSFRKKYGLIFKILGEGGQPVGHVRNFTKRSLLGIIHEHGFDIVEVRASGWLNCWKKGSLLYRIDIVISHLCASLGSNLIVLARKHGK